MGLLWIGKTNHNNLLASSLLIKLALMLTPTLLAIVATHSIAKINGLGNKLSKAMAVITTKYNAQFCRVFFKDLTSIIERVQVWLKCIATKKKMRNFELYVKH
jgi:hypothetical protein